MCFTSRGRKKTRARSGTAGSRFASPSGSTRCRSGPKADDLHDAADPIRVDSCGSLTKKRAAVPLLSQKNEKSWPEGQGNGEGQSVPASPAVPSVPVAAAAAATAAVAAEGPELELPVSASAALTSLAAVATAPVARLALVFDCADIERRVDVLDHLLRLRHRAVLPDVQSDVPAHEGDVAVVDEERLVLVDTPDLVIPEGQEDGPGLVANRRFDEVSRFAAFRRDLSLFTQTDHLDQDIHLLGGGGQVFHFRHCFVFHVLPSADTSRRVAKAGKTVTSRIQTLWADFGLRDPPIKTFGSGRAQHCDGTHRSRPRANSFDVGTIFLPRLHLPMRAHARRRIRTRSHGHPCQRHEAL